MYLVSWYYYIILRYDIICFMRFCRFPSSATSRARNGWRETDQTSRRSRWYGGIAWTKRMRGRQFPWKPGNARHRV